MKKLVSIFFMVARLVSVPALMSTAHADPISPASDPIALAELGAKTSVQYHGEGLSVVATPDGARLRCVFQKLEGEVTREGLWLASTAEPSLGEKFRLTASALGRGDELMRLPTN